MMIANPSALPVQEQLALDSLDVIASPSRTVHENNKEKELRRRNVLFGKTICSLKNTVSSVLTAMGLRERQSVTLQNNSHSRSYDELGHGEHMASEGQLMNIDLRALIVISCLKQLMIRKCFQYRRLRHLSSNLINSHFTDVMFRIKL